MTLKLIYVYINIYTCIYIYIHVYIYIYPIYTINKVDPLEIDLYSAPPPVIVRLYRTESGIESTSRLLITPLVYSETCLNRTLNKQEFCINRTFIKVQMQATFVNLTCINRTPV